MPGWLIWPPVSQPANDVGSIIHVISGSDVDNHIDGRLERNVC